MIVRGIVARQRNLELLLLGGSIGFVLLAWRALEAAAFALPESTERIVLQFVATALAGHLALRWCCPDAPGQLYAIVMMLAGIGLMFVTRLAPGSAQDQANWISLGTVLLVATAFAGQRYELLRRYTYTAALLALILLVITGLVGTTLGGARLWLSVGGYTVQSTEVIKVGLVVFLAGYLAQAASILSMPTVRFGGRTYSSLPYLVPLAATWLVLILALALLRDLGSVALLLGLAIAAMYVATGLVRYVAAGVGLLAMTAMAGYLLFSHVRVRIDTWLNPMEDPLGAGFQSAQSSFAIQAGGITGEGMGMGRPDVIPAGATDYIFTAIAEELGLVGALSVVLLFGLLVVAGLRIALMARDPFGRMLASSVSLLIGIQALIIIGGNLRIIPTTGITLPFVSYGGSSLVVNLILMGLLLAIAQRSRRPDQA
jgi:cell division protein FtsW (lipid II flippase)